MREPALKSIADVEVAGKNVLIRGDLDVEDGDNPRVQSVREIVQLVQTKGAAGVRVIGHRETEYPICDQLRREFPNAEFDDQLRTDPGEKANDEEFAKRLAEGFDVYVNEAFAVAHRPHASIIGLPKVMKAMGKEVCAGPRFEKELEMLDQALGRPGHKLLVAAGVKTDKVGYIARLEAKFDMILAGGKLPLLGVAAGPKIKVATLREDGLDIDDESIQQFKVEIDRAETIVAAGVMGKYEDPGAQRGTREVLEAIAGSSAYKLAGGGDIETAISNFGLAEKFDWISVGGGAMLEYLAAGTLVGLEAIS